MRRARQGRVPHDRANRLELPCSPPSSSTKLKPGMVEGPPPWAQPILRWCSLQRMPLAVKPMADRPSRIILRCLLLRARLAVNPLAVRPISGAGPNHWDGCWSNSPGQTLMHSSAGNRGKTQAKHTDLEETRADGERSGKRWSVWSVGAEMKT